MAFWNPKKLALLRRVPRSPGPYKAAIFIHGFSSNPTDTWTNLFELCSSDEQLVDFALDHYGYPSALIRLPFTKRMASLQELASGLRTELDVRHAECVDLTLVGHSLGGLVIRQYLVNEIKAGRDLRAKKAVLYAVPNTGAGVAAVGRMLSWNHRHLAQLCTNSDVLDVLNDDWAALNVENIVDITYVIGGADAVVKTESARLYKAQNAKTLIGETHRSITKAANSNDLRFIVLKQTLLNGNSGKVAVELESGAANPLFERYSLSDEPFFVKRDIDAGIREALTAGHVWIHGSSGVGKTASVSRSTAVSGLLLRQILLASYEDKTSIGLLRALCVELAAFSGIDAPDMTVRDIHTLIASIKKSLVSVCEAQAVVFLIDEFPLAPSENLGEFLELMVSLTSAVAADPKLHGRVVFAFCSIEDPSASANGHGSKMRERFNFMKLHAWSPDELRRLVDLLAGLIKPELSDNDRQSVVDTAVGSPRFVKMLFRRWKYGTAGNATVSELIESVRMELV